jgi:hypothetical protein
LNVRGSALWLCNALLLLHIIYIIDYI